MKRVQANMKAALFAVMVAIAGLFAMNAAPATAALPSLPPVITQMPTDPSTQAAPIFKYKVDPAETGATTAFFCRAFNGAPPANPNTGYGQCGLLEDLEDGIGTYQAKGLNNGLVGFQVKIRSTESGSEGDSPAATFAWTMNAANPTLAPVFAEKPDDPNTTDQINEFVFAGAPGEENNVNNFDCRLDGGSWVNNCGANSSRLLGVRSITPGNGIHTMEIRAKRGTGGGTVISPVASYTWTNEVPNPMNPSVFAVDVALSTWNGGKANDGLGEGTTNADGSGVENAGDVNGDGLDDILTGSLANSSTIGEALVLFSSGSPVGTRSTGSFGPALGYAMRPAGGAVFFYGYAPLGDQNGDDTPDFAVQWVDSGFNFKNAIVYGVSDPASLPQCAVGQPKRCLDLDALTNDQGYYLTDGVNRIAPVGDFDGDGSDDFLVAQVEEDLVTVVKGASRTGTVDPTAVPAGQKLTINGVPDAFFGANPNAVGDFNQDGKDDVAVSAGLTGIGNLVYGREFSDTPLDLAAFTQNDGMILAGPSLTSIEVAAAGDVNGDSRPDLAATVKGGGTNSTGFVTIIYGPEQPTDLPLLPEAVEPGAGYMLSDEGTDSAFGRTLAPLGDLNNDGVPDLLAGASDAVANGFLGAGATYALFGQRPEPAETLGVMSSLTPSLGLAVTSDFGATAGMGDGIAPLGDIDGDNIPDFATSAPEAAANGTESGSIYIISGGSLMANAKTGAVTNVLKESAMLNASVTTTGRDSDVTFEYGTTDEYGSETEAIEVEGSNTGTPVSAELTGLEGNTEYHYRTITTNSLGLTYYGDDQTFSTNSDEGPSPCDADDTLPGCVNYDPCAADDTKPGCPGYNHCAVKPADCKGGNNKPTKARLKVITITKKMVVKRGKRGTVQVAVINTGGKAAKGVKVCVKAPKRLVKVKKCVKVGSLGSGASRTVKIKVQAKKKRGKAVLNLTARGNNVSAKKAKTRVVIR